MKKHLFFIFFFVLAGVLSAQAPVKFTYQAVVRDATNHLVTNSSVGMRISILQGGVNGNVQYMETHNAVTNSNGLVTVVIGSGNLLQGSISTIDWSAGPMFLQTDIDPNGGSNYTITSTQQLLSVPYALYAGEAANGFSGDYNDLSNLPQIPQIPSNVSYFINDAGYITMDSIPSIPNVPTNLSAFSNDAGYITGYTETDPLFNAWDKNYNDLTNKPTLFDGNYNSLSNKPLLFSGDYNDLTNRPVIPTVPTNVSAFTNDAGYITGYTETDPLFNAWDKNYNDLTNKPTLFSGNYNDLTNKPSLFSGNYNDLSNKPVLFDWDYYSLNNRPTIPTVPTNVSAFTNDAGYITGYTETDPLFNAWDKNYNDLTNKPVIPTVPTNVSAFTNDAGYITGYTETDPLFNAWDKNYNDLTNKPVIPTVPTNVSAFSNDAGYITGYTETDPQFNAWDKNYNDLTNKPVIPTVPTNVSAFTNDAGYITGEQQVLSISNDTIFLTGGSFVKLPESLTENQVNLMIHQCCDSMQQYVDNTITGTLNNVITPQLSDAFRHYLDSIAEALAQEYIDSIQNIPHPIVSHDSTFSTGPCPEAPYVTDWDGNVYPTVKIGSQCWMRENLRTWHAPDGKLIPATYENGPHRIRPDDNTENVPTYGYLYNYEAVFGTLDTSILTNANPSGIQGICPDGWHVPSLAEWEQLRDYMGNYSMYICDDQTAYVAKALAAQTGWEEWNNLCAIGNDLSANNASGFSALPAGDREGPSTRNFGMYAFFWTTTRTPEDVFSVKTIRLQCQTAECHMDSRTDFDASISVRCLRNPSDTVLPDTTLVLPDTTLVLPDTTPVNPPCPSVSLVISGETTVCEGESAILTANGAQSYVWSNGMSGNSITVNTAGTYFVTGTDANGCEGTATVSVTVHFPQHESVTETACDSIMWHGQTYTTSGSYTYSHSDINGCTQVDTLHLTITSCTSDTTRACHVSGTHPAQTGSTYQGNGYNGANHGLETVVNGLVTSVTDYDGNEYPVVQIGSQCWLAENMRCTHSPSTGTYIVHHNNPSSSNYTYTGKQARWYTGIVTMNGNTVMLDSAACVAHHFGLLYNWNAAVDVFNAAYGELSINANSNNAVGTSFSGDRQGICPIGWHVPSDAEWSLMENLLNGYDVSNSITWRGSHAGKLTTGDDWNNSTVPGAPGNYDTLRNESGFSAVPAGFFEDSFVNAGITTPFWSSSIREGYMYFAWGRSVTYSNVGVYRDTYYKKAGCAVRCLRDESSVDVTTQTPPTTITSSVSDITPTSATITSNVTADGGTTVTERGICWGTAHNPTINDSHTADGAGIGMFNSLLSELTPGTTYFVRSYATNNVGTNYGDEISFTTTVFVDTTNIPSGDAQTCPGTPILTDIDNNIYNTVKIGNQCWMKENLRTTRFADGTSIPYSYDFNETTPYRCPADSNLEYVTTFGYLYNWKAAMRDECLSNSNPSGVQGACPDGWHLPSQAEWQQLLHYVKNQAIYTQSSDTNIIAKAMASQFGWVNSSYDFAVGNNPDANNQTGFSILPAGFYGIHTDVDSLFNFHFGKYTVLWSSSKKLEDRSYNGVFYVHADSSKIHDKLMGAGHAVYASIRCLRNNSETGNVSDVDIQNIRTILDTNHVTSTSALVYGLVPSVSNADVDFYGICISTSPNPTVDGIHSTYYTNPILFGTTFTDLATNTTYYVRAYAQSCNTTFYGPEISFTTLPCDDYTTIIVHDTVNMDASLFLLYEDFEADGLPDGWSILDNDGDGNNWNHSGNNSNLSSHSGSGCMFSESYLNNVAPLTPDNYLITPALTIPTNTPTTLSWYVIAQDSNWRAEHYEVRLSTSGTNASDFNQLLFENTISSSEFTHHEVDLSSYSGQTVHIAFVHNNCTDMFRLNLDDIFVYTGSQTYPIDYTEIQTGECISIVKHYVIVCPFSEGMNFSPAPEGYNATRDGTYQYNSTNQGTKRVNSSVPANSSVPEMNINAPHSSGNGVHSKELFSE